MNRHFFSVIVRSVIVTVLSLPVGTLAVTTEVSGDDESSRVTLDDFVVVLIDEASIPATVSGPVAGLSVREGDRVARGDLVATIDDRDAELQKQLADRDLEIALETSRQRLGVEAAEAASAETRQLSERHETERQINRRKAANDLKVQAAEKAEAVARNEYQRAVAAKESFEQAVSDSEIEALLLAQQRARLETRQAVFEQELAELEMAIDDAIAQSFRLQMESRRVQIRQAESDDRIAAWKTSIEQHQADLAALRLEKHRLTSPIAGVVVAVAKRPGDWVDPGQSIARIAKVDRLRVEGFLPAKWIRPLQNQADLSISVRQADGTTTRRTGGRRFISPEIDPVTQETRCWVEFDNRDLAVQPGLPASIEISVR